MDIGYGPEWQVGKWTTNTNEGEFIPVYINGEESKSAVPFTVKPGIYRMGPPKATLKCSVKKLEGMGLVGVYIIKAIEDTTETSMQQEIAMVIRDSIHLGPCSQLGGVGWMLELDEHRMAEYNTDEFAAVMEAIAGFIEDGQVQGITPFWRLNIS